MHAFTLPVTNPVLVFALVMLIILAAPLLFNRLRVPGLVGLLLAGVAVGPHALGVLDRGETMELLGTVGLLYIMFVAGLEVDLHQFARYRRQSLLFGALTFGLPQVLGALAGALLLGYSLPVAILLGSIIASHTLVAYPLVSRLGLSKNAAVTTAVGATIITDTAALLVLAVVAGSAEGELNAAFWLRLGGLFGLYVAVVFFTLPRLGRAFFRTARESDGVAGFVFVLAAVFTTAFAAELAGVEPIIGAFMAGLALNRLVPEQGTLMNRIQFVGESLFIPFFLISVGMLVDVRVFVEGTQAWVVAGIMLGALFAGKGLAAAATHRLFGYGSDERRVVFGLTVVQAAATLAAAIVGYELGLLDGDVLNGTILMILVTCVLGPWVADRYGRRLALAEAEKPYEPSEAPQRILVPLMEAGDAAGLAELAMMIRDPRSEQPLYPLTVARQGADVEARVAASEKLLGHAVRHAAAADVPVVPLTRVDTDVAGGIGRAITEERITTVVLGWNGENAARQYVFGRVLDPLVERTRGMLLVSRLVHPVNTLERVVVAIPPFAEREAGFAAALHALKVLASQLGAGLHVVALAERVPILEDMVRRTRPETPATFDALDEWGGLVGALEGLLRPSDLLVLATVREGALAWRPGLRRLPRVLAARFPETGLIFLYLSETARPAAPEAPEQAAGAPEVLLPASVVFGLEGDTWEAVLDRLLAPAPGEERPWWPAASRTVSAFGPDYAPELSPGVVLLQAPVPGLPAPALFVGLSEGGLNLARAAHPVHVVLALLSPETDDAEAQEARLTDVARLLRSPGIQEALRTARTPEAVRDVLVSRLQEPQPGYAPAA